MEGEERTTKYAKGAKRETKLLFKDDSYKIVGGCFEIYKEKGNGFLEAVCQECLGSNNQLFKSNRQTVRSIG